MTCREVITEPFERVCIDIVDPLPKARGGYQLLLTYIGHKMARSSSFALYPGKARDGGAVKNIFPKRDTSGYHIRPGDPIDRKDYTGAGLNGWYQQSGVQSLQATIQWHCREVSWNLNSLIEKVQLAKARLGEVFADSSNAAMGSSPYMLVHGRE